MVCGISVPCDVGHSAIREMISLSNTAVNINTHSPRLHRVHKWFVRIKVMEQVRLVEHN